MASASTVAHPNRLASFVACTEQVAEELMPPVEPSRVRAEEPFHPRHQISPRRLQHQMKMILHQIQRLHFPTRLAARFPQGGQKKRPIVIIPEDGAP